jgi:hypothetical protein
MSGSTFVLVVTALCALASQASGAPVTWEFEAVVRGSVGTPPDPFDPYFFHEGQVFSGSLTFESTTPDTNAHPDLGTYALAGVHMEYRVGVDPFPPGPFTFGDLLSSAPSAITVVDLGLALSADRLFFDGSLDPATFSPAGTNAPSFTTFTLALLYSPDAGGAPYLTGDQLPFAPPPAAGLAPFSLPDSCGNASTYLCFHAPNGYRVGAELTMLRVPEPATLALLLAAFGAVACFRRGSRGSIAA